MSLRLRLLLLIALLATFPSLVALLVTRQLVDQSLELALSDELDLALEAGLRRSSESYRARRDELRACLEVWPIVASLADTRAFGASLLDQAPDCIQATDRVTLQSETEHEITLQPGEPIPAPAAQGDVPSALRVERELGGRTVVIERQLDAAWRQDAALLQQNLQRLRALRTERTLLERSFWLPFAVVYALTLVCGVVGALWITRGLTRPVDNLLALTEDVVRGRWAARAKDEGPRELVRLAQAMNRMLATMEAQHRSLIDLEKMAGWREMARTLAHEVKNPLTPIQLTVEEMRQRYRGSDVEYQKLLDHCTRIVVEEVNSLRDIVERFREFSRPVELRPVTVDLNSLLGDIAALQRDFSVSTDLDSSLPSIEADPDRLRQLFMNLAENARNALTGRDGARLLISTRRVEGKLRVAIEDNGPGVRPEERERVFEPYRSGRAGGLGLGLALAKGIVLAHDGRIWVEASTLGGASFQVELPLREPAKPRG